MTTIAISKEMMAADTQMDDGGTTSNIRKVFRVNGDLIGFAGEVNEGLKFVEWYLTKDEEGEEIALDNTSAVVLTKEGKIYTYESHLPIEILDPHYAIGSGAQAALVAMDQGHDPIQAIKIASKRDAYTGSEVYHEKI